jgi:hypothetical protein
MDSAINLWIRRGRTFGGSSVGSAERFASEMLRLSADPGEILYKLHERERTQQGMFSE